ncbi:hypothetical protein TNCV_1314311 [Trichonephila clavipes]|nr:hypothetical protein TNCV_1314311 [Trichonephila clavipes]
MSESGPSVIQRLQDQIKLKDTESRSHDFGRPHIITFATDRFLTFSDPRRTATANVANHFIASGTRISATTVCKPPSQCISLCQTTSCVYSAETTTEVCRLCWTREYVSCTRQQ